MNVWRMNDENEYWLYPTDWTVEMIRAHYVEFCGLDPDDMDDFPELIEDADLDTLKIAVCDDNENPTGETQTFREHLKEFAKDIEPTYFCGGDW